MGIRHTVNEVFFRDWNPRMAYTLGYIFADGCLEYYPRFRQKYVSIASTDKDTLERLRDWMDSKHRISSRKSPHANGAQIFVLRIGNARLYDSLTLRGLYPRKSLTVPFPQVPKDILHHFVRGYFDGDGCVALEKVIRKSGAIRPRKLNVIFTSGSETFLHNLALALERFSCVKPQNIIRAWTAFQLRYSTTDSEALFRFMYSDATDDEYLKRKHAIFIEHFSLKS
ncbi:MAG: LAGLIDADG family homing endonuclease [bacterium]|nr:LAGLIDADG family homing endonuclease [bacterium]